MTDKASSGDTMAGRIRRGLVSQLFFQVAITLMRLAEVPLMLHFLGVEAYGIWLLISVIPVYFLIGGDFGLNGAMAREMTMLISRGDIEESRRLFHAVLSVVFLFASCLSIALLLALLQFDNMSFFADVASQNVTAIPAATLLIIYAFIRLLAGTINTAFYSGGKYDLAINIYSIGRLFEFLLMTIVLICGGGFVFLGLAYLLAACVEIIFIFRVAKSNFPWLRIFVFEANWHLVRKLLRPAMSNMAFPLGIVMSQQGVRLVIGPLGGTALVATLGVFRTLVGFAPRFLDAFGNAIEPEFARAFGANDIDRTKLLLVSVSRYSFWAGVPIILMLYFTGEYIIGKWTLNKIQFDSELFLLLLCSALVNIIWYNMMKSAYATNRHSRIAMMSLISYSGSCVVAAVLFPFFGLSGVGMALLVSELVIACYVIPACLSMSHVSYSEWLSAMLKPPLREIMGIITRAFQALRSRWFA